MPKMTSDVWGSVALHVTSVRTVAGRQEAFVEATFVDFRGQKLFDLGTGWVKVGVQPKEEPFFIHEVRMQIRLSFGEDLPKNEAGTGQWPP